MENLSTIIICAVLALICVYAAASYKKKLKSGCCGGGDIKIKPADKNIAHYPYAVTVYIDGMTCEHCRTRVENAFNSTGEYFAKVNLKRRCAQLSSKRQIDEREIRDIVCRAGYTYNKCVY